MSLFEILRRQRRGAIELIQETLRSRPGAIRERNQDGELPLHVAADYGEGDLVRFLARQWPQALRERDLQGKVPLHHAAEESLEVVEFLAAEWPEAIRE
jgi:ankyrin repeat protein